jgi:hypothetical protein
MGEISMGFQVDYKSIEDAWGILETTPQEMRVKLLNDADKTWVYAQTLICRKEFPEAEKMKVFGRFGLEAGEVYVKVLSLEELI